MSEQGLNAAESAELLALLRAQEERRAKRKRVLVWLAVAAVVLGGVLAVVVHQQREQARQDRVETEMYCDMVYGFGSPSYERCVE